MEFFLWNPLIPPGTSFNCGKQLYDSVSALANDLAREAPITAYEVFNIVTNLQTFETVLAAEYALKDTFVVSRKGIFSTTELIERSEFMFSDDVRKLLPDIIRDIHDAGKCIAFELSTAAAFHLYRATEAAAKQYILKVRGTQVTEKERRFGLGGYAKIMVELRVDERISNAVSQLTKLHRNPAIHPEHHLSSDEVIAILGIVQSVIQVMALDIYLRENAPQMPLLEVLPDDSEYEYPPTEDPIAESVRLGNEEDSLSVEAGTTKTIGSG